MNFIDNFYRLTGNKIFIRMVSGIAIIIVIIIASFIMLRYQVEGENDKNLPFKLSKIIIISTVEGKSKNITEDEWDIDLIQNNDIYVSIDKNEEHKRNEIIRSVSIENIKVNKKYSIGIVKNYKPSKDGLFKNEEEYIISDGLKYTGSAETNINNQTIGNQGGTILFRSSNIDVGSYKTPEKEITYNGLLLSKANLTNEQIKYSIDFDITIEIKRGTKYRATVSMELPEGDLINNPTTSTEKKDLEDVIFKRI